MSDPEDRLGRLRSWVDTAESETAPARAESERARDYYDGRQWTAEEVAVLSARRQPIVTDNRIRGKINWLLGSEKRGRTDPRAYPRNPDDEQAAQAATDAIRYVCDAATFEQTASAVLEDMLIEGYGGVDVIVADEADGINIKVEHFPWDRLFYDPHSRRLDFSDAKYLGGMAWMDEEDVLVRWPNAEAAITGAYAHQTSGSTTYEDRPHLFWADMSRKRIRVIQIHWLERGVWWFATMTAGGFLDDPAASPYLDADGRPACSLVLQSTYVDRDNRRHGLIRDMFDLQDEVNKRRSKAMHLLSVRTVISEQGAVEDVDAARAEVARPDGYIEVAPTMRFEIKDNLDLAQGQFRMLEDAKAALEGQGPNAFLSGKQSQAASGRAIMASQQGGATELDGTAMERFRLWKRRVYMAIWDRIRQFWTEEKWVRVTDDERNIRFVGLNKRVTVLDHLMALPPDQRAIAVQSGGLMPDDPRLQQLMIGPDGRPIVENNVAEMTVDIVVDDSPDVVTLQTEEFQKLAELAAAQPGLIPPDVLIQASSLRNKDQLLERMRPPVGPDGQPVPPPPPPELLRAQMQMQIDQQRGQIDAQMKAAELQSELAADQMRLEAELEAQRRRAEHEMDLARAKAMLDMQLQREKAALDAELKRDVAGFEAATRLMARSVSEPEDDPPPGNGRSALTAE